MEQWAREIEENFLRFAVSHPNLIQVRYIAEDGQEWVRVNYRAGVASLVPPGELPGWPDLAKYGLRVAQARLRRVRALGVAAWRPRCRTASHDLGSPGLPRLVPLL